MSRRDTLLVYLSHQLELCIDRKAKDKERERKRRKDATVFALRQQGIAVSWNGGTKGFKISVRLGVSYPAVASRGWRVVFRFEKEGERCDDARDSKGRRREAREVPFCSSTVSFYSSTK